TARATTRGGAMSKRWRAQLLIGVALVLVALAVTIWLLAPPPGSLEVSSGWITPGMTLSEVEAVLGKHDPEGRQRRGFDTYMSWNVPEGIVGVTFGPDERVSKAELWGVPVQRPSLLARLRAWLGW